MKYIICVVFLSLNCFALNLPFNIDAKFVLGLESYSQKINLDEASKFDKYDLKFQLSKKVILNHKIFLTFKLIGSEEYISLKEDHKTNIRSGRIQIELDI